MHLITRKRLNEFVAQYPDARTGIAHWYWLIKNNNFDSFVHLRQLFPSADQVDHKTVFNIGGNKYRLIAAIHYNRRKVYIRAIVTHLEYDKNKWKKD